MKTKRIFGDTMLEHRIVAIKAVNSRFNQIAGGDLHRDSAHARKRELAKMITSGSALPSYHPFVQEALMKSMTQQEMAELIITKPNKQDLRELDRQRLLLEIENAKTPGVLHELVYDLDNMFPSPVIGSGV